MACYIDICDPRLRVKQEGSVVNYYTTNEKDAVIKLECHIDTCKMRTLKKHHSPHSAVKCRILFKKKLVTILDGFLKTFVNLTF